MEGRRRCILSPMMVVVVLLIFSMAVMVPEVSATRWIVGSNMGWTTNVNYTVWAQDKQFYNGDWLFFVYDRHQMNVLEVKKTDYEACNADHPLHNWTTGAGRDVVPLNVTRHYYFISDKEFCLSGMRLAIRVQNPPPPPTAVAPSKSDPPLPPPAVAPSKSEPPRPIVAPSKSDSPLLPPTSAPSKSDAPLLPPTSAPSKSDAPLLPPTPAPSKSDAPAGFTYRGHYVQLIVLGIGALWDAFVYLL